MHTGMNKWPHHIPFAADLVRRGSPIDAEDPTGAALLDAALLDAGRAIRHMGDEYDRLKTQLKTVLTEACWKPWGVEDRFFWLENTPTITEIREMNKHSIWTFPLSLLLALMDANVDIDANADAVLRQVVHMTPDTVDLRIQCVKSGRLLASLAVGNHRDGGEFFFVPVPHQ